MRRPASLLSLIAALSLAGCGWISFRKPPSDDETRLTREVKAFYTEIQRAFAVGNAQALTSLFDPSITRPMTKPEVQAWAETFFAAHGRARFKILSLTIEDIGFLRAVVTLKYQVEPADGKGGFGATEEDTLVKRTGHWYVASWEKVP
jgi:hypothetical protein